MSDTKGRRGRKDKDDDTRIRDLVYPRLLYVVCDSDKLLWIRAGAGETGIYQDRLK